MLKNLFNIFIKQKQDFINILKNNRYKRFEKFKT